jgi:hypothetical protein
MALKPMKTYGVMMDSEVWDMLHRQSERRMVPISELVRIAVADYLVKRGVVGKRRFNPAGRLVPADLPDADLAPRRGRKPKTAPETPAEAAPDPEELGNLGILPFSRS